MVRNLLILLETYARSHDLGEVLDSPVDVVFTRHSVLEPDLIFIARARSAIVRKKHIKGPPDLVVEVSSPSTIAVDRGRKLDTYRKHGVSEYWIVELVARVVEVHEFGRAPRTRIHEEGQAFATARMPGLKVRVDEIFQMKRR